MSLESKKRRIKELQNEMALSDQDHEELERLKEEVIQEATEQFEQAHAKLINSMEDNESSFQQTNINLGVGKGEIIKVKPEGPSMIKRILRVAPKKPVTQEEIDNLKKQVIAEELKARIRVAKAKAPKPNIIERVLGKSSVNPFDMSRDGNRHKNKGSSFSWI